MTLKIDPKTGDGMLSNGVVFKADFLTAALGSAWQGLAKNVECELHYFARAVGKRELNREDADGFAAWLEAMPAIHGYGREKISFAIIALERRSEPPRVCRRLQLLRRWSHDEQDDEQVLA